MPGCAGRPAANVGAAARTAAASVATLICVTCYYYVARGTNLTPRNPSHCDANYAGPPQRMANLSAGFDSLYKHDSGCAGHHFSSIGTAAKSAPWGGHYLG